MTLDVLQKAKIETIKNKNPMYGEPLDEGRAYSILHE